MERELWAILRRAGDDVKRHRPDSNKHTFSTADIARVYLWAALHDRPVSWACDPRAWGSDTRPALLPHQSTVSRRMRTDAFGRFLSALTRRLSAWFGPTLDLLKRLDGKPLFVPSHSQDPQATWGRGAGQVHRGYKLHALWGAGPLPIAFAVRGLADDEKRVARTLLPRLTGGGYVLADAFYDANALHRLAAEHGHQLVAPRRRTSRGRGLGHRRHHEGRRRSVALTEPTPHTNAAFGRGLCRARRQIETRFGHLTGFCAGLTHLPPWTRGLHRVSLWVHAKLLINAARIKCRA